MIDLEPSMTRLTYDDVEKIKTSIESVIFDLKNRPETIKYLNHKPWCIWSLNIEKASFEINNHFKNDLIKLEKDKFIIEKMLLGYYQNRLILYGSMHIGEEYSDSVVHLGEIFKKYFDTLFTQNSKNPIIEQPNNDYIIKYIYSYPLIISQDGGRFLSSENYSFETIFSYATTSFIFPILDLKSNLPIGRLHNIIVTNGSVSVFTSGCLSNFLFLNLINAIYLGGLYTKMKGQRGFTFKNRDNIFSEGIVMDISALIGEHVTAIQYSRIAINIGSAALALSSLAIIITILINFLGP
ncbi:MAG: hypothetical protein ACOWWR_08740 [Eubacteriales bacterium]